ncbi:MAG TPA: putative selenate ABC transporter substrate-binding protein [Gallionella sp.]|nr:putative selenate ABC transporter substrate-binding protein [Gallionella sp.]
MLPLSSSPRLRALLISLAIAAGLLLYAVISAEPVMRVSLIPEEKPSIMRRKLKPLTDYLEKKIGMKIEFRPVANEEALVDALVANKVDLAWFSGYDYIAAKQRSHDQVIPIMQRAEDAQTRSVFITARAGIMRLEDLKGRTFAFGAETSASDHLMPRAFLRAALVDPDIEMKRVIYSDTPGAVVAAVASGEADAGVLNKAAWKKLQADGKADPKVLRVFYTTAGYSDYNWTARSDMDAIVRRKLIDAFLSLDGKIGQEKEILELQHASKFIPTDNENYSAIETVARSTGLLK